MNFSSQKKKECLLNVIPDKNDLRKTVTDIIKDEPVNTCILLVILICRDAGGDTGEGDKKERAPKKTKEEEVLALTTRTGGAYIPPARLRAMQASITDKSR